MFDIEGNRSLLQTEADKGELLFVLFRQILRIPELRDASHYREGSGLRCGDRCQAEVAFLTAAVKGVNVGVMFLSCWETAQRRPSVAMPQTGASRRRTGALHGDAIGGNFEEGEFRRRILKQRGLKGVEKNSFDESHLVDFAERGLAQSRLFRPRIRAGQVMPSSRAARLISDDGSGGPESARGCGRSRSSSSWMAVRPARKPVPPHSKQPGPSMKSTFRHSSGFSDRSRSAWHRGFGQGVCNARS